MKTNHGKFLLIMYNGHDDLLILINTMFLLRPKRGKKNHIWRRAGFNAVTLRVSLGGFLFINDQYRIYLQCAFEI